MKKMLLILVAALFIMSCKNETEKEVFINENVVFAAEQTNLMLANAGEPSGKNYPRTVTDDGQLVVTNMYDWTSGFFPGSLWYLYELTLDEKWKNEAEKWTATLEPLKTFTQHHDLGFMVYCSFGNAERLASKPEYKDIIVESAASLSTRFDERTQAIKSWNQFKSWNSENDKWFYPVIIDNMMNLELLFYASKVTGDKKYYDIAVKHADTTLKNQFREDFGTYHVVNYDSINGEVLNKGAAQGYSDNSIWSRGQAWAIYGFTMTYRETKDKRYLDAAIKATDRYLRDLPEDLIPLWDFNVGEEGYTPGYRSYATEFKEKLRDVSAGAIVTSALFELSEHAEDSSYYELAVEMLHNLASSAYRSKPGTNMGFLLQHSVGSIPHKFEIDKPLVYADYYFFEALTRYRNKEITKIKE